MSEGVPMAGGSPYPYSRCQWRWWSYQALVAPSVYSSSAAEADRTLLSSRQGGAEKINVLLNSSDMTSWKTVWTRKFPAHLKGRLALHYPETFQEAAFPVVLFKAFSLCIALTNAELVRKKIFSSLFVYMNLSTVAISTPCISLVLPLSSCLSDST